VGKRFGGKCRRCYDSARRPSSGKQTPLPVLIEEAEFLFEGGASAKDVAKRLGVKHSSLVRAFYRGKAKGLTKRHLSENTRKRDE